MDSRLLNTLHYLFSEFGGKTVAHCLDLDIVTSGTSIADAEQRLDGLVKYMISTSGERKLGNTPAPLDYWKANSTAHHLQPKQLEIEIPPQIVSVRRKEAIPVLRSSQVVEAA